PLRGVVNAVPRDHHVSLTGAEFQVHSGQEVRYALLLCECEGRMNLGEGDVEVSVMSFQVVEAVDEPVGLGVVVSHCNVPSLTWIAANRYPSCSAGVSASWDS